MSKQRKAKCDTCGNLVASSWGLYKQDIDEGEQRPKFMCLRCAFDVVLRYVTENRDDIRNIFDAMVKHVKNFHGVDTDAARRAFDAAVGGPEN